MIKRFIPSVAITIALLVLPAQAGTSGVLNGFARTERGEPISGATVVAVSASQFANTTTDAQGFFVFVDLPPDAYTVAIEKSGYHPDSYTGTRVNSDHTTFLALTMDRPPFCGGKGQPVDEGDEDFISLDLRIPSAFPRPLQFSTPAVPGPKTRFFGGCL